MYKKIIWGFLIFLLLVLQYRLWIGEGSITYVLHLKNKTKKQEAINQQLDERNKRLEARIQEYREGQDILEEQARSQLGMIKQDETFIQVIEENESKKDN